jgi:hypothetical protein
VILVAAVLLVAACVAASARRVLILMRVPALDPRSFATRLQATAGGLSDADLSDLGRALAADSDTEWEQSLVLALAAEPDARAALLGEAMTELDFAARLWLRVPRVAASLASSVGFLLATLQLRMALSVATASDGEGLEVNAALLGAVDVIAVGLAGAAACLAIQRAARALLSERLAGAHQLLDALESSWERGPWVGASPHASVASRQGDEQVSSPVTASSHVRELA